MQTSNPRDTKRYDVVVIGGGAAGLSGALTLGRARRSVLVIDGGEPRNAPADAVHGFLSRDGIPPADLLEIGRAEIHGYGVEIRCGQVVSAQQGDDGFILTLNDGSSVRGRRLLVATGSIDELPEVPGPWERWGRDVLHCPYCHGWEVRDEAIGILATNAFGAHQALLFRQLTDNVTLFLHTGPRLSNDEIKQIAARDITVVAGEVTALEIANDRLAGVRLDNAETVAIHALVVAPRFIARSGMLAGLGLARTEHPSGMGEYIAADATGLTAVPSVWVAGNVSDAFAQVSGAATAGAIAAAQSNADLIAEETRLAVASYRERLLYPVGA